MQIDTYDTDLTDGRWNPLEPLLPAPKRLGRPPTPGRILFNAVLYLVNSGCPWRLLPKSFPPWQTVYHRFRKWCEDGTWLLLNEALRAVVRKEEGRNVEPRAAVLDSQTVRCDGHGGAVGYDAGKKTKGRKRFILVDVLGLLLGVDVAQPTLRNALRLDRCSSGCFRDSRACARCGSTAGTVERTSRNGWLSELRE